MLNPKLVDMQSTGYGLVGRELRSLVADTFEVILPQAPLRGGGVAPVLSFGPLLNRWPSASRPCSAARSTARTPTIGPCGARTPAQPTGPRLLEPFPECSPVLPLDLLRPSPVGTPPPTRARAGRRPTTSTGSSSPKARSRPAAEAGRPSWTASQSSSRGSRRCERPWRALGGHQARRGARPAASSEGLVNVGDT